MFDMGHQTVNVFTVFLSEERHILASTVKTPSRNSVIKCLIEFQKYETI